MGNDKLRWLMDQISCDKMRTGPAAGAVMRHGEMTTLGGIYDLGLHHSLYNVAGDGS